MNPMKQFVKDPAAILDYSIDWSALIPGDPITAASVTVSSGITVSNSTFTTTHHKFRLSGGTAGTSYLVTSQIDTQTGQRDKRSILIAVAAQ